MSGYFICTRAHTHTHEHTHTELNKELSMNTQTITTPVSFAMCIYASDNVHSSTSRAFEIIHF